MTRLSLIAGACDQPEPVPARVRGYNEAAGSHGERFPAAGRAGHHRGQVQGRQVHRAADANTDRQEYRTGWTS